MLTFLLCMIWALKDWNVLAHTCSEYKYKQSNININNLLKLKFYSSKFTDNYHFTFEHFVLHCWEISSWFFSIINTLGKLFLYKIVSLCNVHWATGIKLQTIVHNKTRSFTFWFLEAVSSWLGVAMQQWRGYPAKQSKLSRWRPVSISMAYIIFSPQFQFQTEWALPKLNAILKMFL